ncbi:eukaryotic translation initiation factor 4 gamma 3 isoform X2 [Acyrthosiphon pisum]|uniref:MI domain-containing protein n=1 Tax=Acyrthosiphon pisum TaxID=7029 RepID=A0A8R1X125_ACYPI|nr:eukaryotic translation initiation factor 4 gamma 3 isoform X2 [Acyrthosiphon pisum]|eukprot:XP_008179446.1 PREDICTED: eukaryotic translation initiation factor 4 gamma 3 isoform X2 [Acyrthosiphon pisum]
MNNRGQNQSHQRKFEGMYTNPNQFPQAVQVQNPGYIISGPRNPRHYVNPGAHNVSDMKNNHMTNMAHSQIQMVPTHISQRQQALPHHIRPNAPRNLPRGPFQYQVYLPSNVAYQGTSNHPAYYPFGPQQASQTAVIMPYVNYPTNQQGMFYSQSTRPIQMTNLPQGPQNPPVANMSNAQNSHGQSLIVQSQPMDMAPNTQPLQQVSQQPSTTPMQITEASSRPARKKTLIKIIDPNTGREIDLNNSLQGPPSADELEKMKVQSQFQSQVQSAVKKDDTKLSDNNPNNEGGEKVRNEFQTQVKKLASESTLPPKAIEVDTQVSEEVVSEVEEISVDSTNIEEVPVAINDPIDIDIGGLTINTEDTSVDVNEVEIETTPTNILPSSTAPPEVEIQNADITNISEDPIPLKKNTDEESVKSVKPKKTKIKKKNNQQKNLVKLDANEGIKVDTTIETTTIEPVIESKTTDILKQQENKENENNNHNSSKNEEEESIIPKPEELLQQPEETQNNGLQHKTVVEDAAPKLPSYLDNLPYAEGQWSIKNPTGKKVYSKLFLMQLGSEAVCQKKPDILRNWSNLTKLSSTPQFNSSGGMMVPNLPRSQSASATGFMPSYFKPGNSQRGSGMPTMQPGAKRNSSQGKTASKTAKPNTIHMSLSLREEVKLNQTENAWVPTAAKKATKSEVVKTKNEEEQKNDEVNKSVRSILNKITPDNMPSLTERFKALPIDTIERLEKTIDLVFEKAIEEQSFAPLYASLCSAMQSVQVSSKDGKTASFKKLIISKCQSLFELDKAQEMDSAKKLTEINSCKDPEKKKELQLEFEENERRLRKRSVGNCRFIGELFKQKILTPNIMLYCIVHLVTKHVEEPLECLCNLLKTVGKELEQSYDLNDTFDKLKALTSRDMKSKIPSRIKFMIQDVIDLRRDKWIPRRTDSKPKMINEIENDVKNEAIEQQSITLAYNRPEKRDHHRGDDKFRGGENKSRRGNENEWNVVQNNTKYKQPNYQIDQSKLQGFKENTSVTTLGPPKWSFTSGKNMTFTSSNPYAVLNDDKKSSNSPQIMSNKNTSRKPVISESEERQRMMSGVASMMPQFAQSTPSINSSSSSQPKEAVEEPVSELDSVMTNKISMKCKNILLEYEQMQNLDDIIYSLSEDETSVIRTRHEEFVTSMSLITLDSSPITRTTVAGKIFAELLSKKILSMDAITRGIDAVLKEWNDYLMDYPQFFSYIAAIIAPLLLSQNASFDFNNLKDSCTSIRPDNSSKFFTEVLNKILSSKETQNIKEQLGGILWIYNKWRTSEYVPLDVFMPNNQINKYFKNDRIGVFLLSIAMYDKMKMTDSKPLYDVLHSWISTNISAEIIKCPQFVRALTIAIVIVCSKPNHSYEDFFDHVHVKLLTCYIRSEPLPEPEIQAREVQCLYGIQIMSAALEHPGGMVLRLFHKLYQDSVISKESFELWKKEDEFKAGFDEDLETKTMAVVVLNSFFLSLAANDSDEEETAE